MESVMFMLDGESGTAHTESSARSLVILQLC